MSKDINSEDLLSFAVQQGIITADIRDQIIKSYVAPLSREQMAIIDILHDLYCPLHHDKDCTYLGEAARTECWNLPAHQKWTRIYHNLYKEHKPADDWEFLAHIQQAGDLLVKTHATVCWLIAYDCMGLPLGIAEEDAGMPGVYRVGEKGESIRYPDVPKQSELTIINIASSQSASGGGKNLDPYSTVITGGNGQLNIDPIISIDPDRTSEIVCFGGGGGYPDPKRGK